MCARLRKMNSIFDSVLQWYHFVYFSSNPDYIRLNFISKKKVAILFRFFYRTIHCFDKQIKKTPVLSWIFLWFADQCWKFYRNKNSLIYWISLWKKGCMHIYAWVCAIFISPIVVLKTRFDHSWPYNPFDERFNIYFPAFCRRFFLRPFILAG